jgi:hypothetical protein
MKLLCSVCAETFYPEQKHFFICDTCKDVYGLWGDTEYLRALRGISLLLNSKYTQEQAEEMAGFASIHKLVDEWIGEMDEESKLRLLKKQIKKMEKK